MVQPFGIVSCIIGCIVVFLIAYITVVLVWCSNCPKESFGNPQVGNPQVGNPQVGNPQVGNPQVGNPQVGNEFDVMKYHDDVFENRIELYMGNLKKNINVSTRNKTFEPSVYFVDSSILDPIQSDYHKDKTAGIYLDEIRLYYQYFKLLNIGYHDSRFIFITGDVSNSRSDIPYLSKTRPIDNPGLNVLLPLNNTRHWGSIQDIIQIPWDKKDNQLIWRGAATGKDKRIPLVEKYWDKFNIGFTNFVDYYTGDKNKKYIKSPITIPDMLKSKYLISAEGNDVATNLKWILSSNSVCLMPLPKMESWLMESKLIPWVHFVPLADNFNDLVEKYNWCERNQSKLQDITRNANDYMSRFKTPELDIINTILLKYANLVKIM